MLAEKAEVKSLQLINVIYIYTYKIFLLISKMINVHILMELCYNYYLLRQDY